MNQSSMRPVHWVLKRRRVGVCGGARITPANAAFCRMMGAQLAGEKDLVIVSGGFKCFRENPDTPSADWSVVCGAIERFRGCGIRHDSLIETLLPDEDWSKVERFREGQVTVLRNFNLRARRFAVVSAADVLIAVEGVNATAEIVDLSLAFSKPVLPLPFTGGCAREKWEVNKEQIRKWFDIDDTLAETWESLRLEAMSSQEMAELAAQVRQVLLQRLRLKCFVMMPFARDYSGLYEQAIRPAIEECGFSPVRTDTLNLVGNVVEFLRAAIATCACAMAVLSGNNPNVLYELGLAHAVGKPVILICRAQPDKEQFPHLPYDLRNESVVGYREDMQELRCVLAAMLRQLKGQ